MLRRLLVSSTALAVALVACGDDGPPPARTAFLPPAAVSMSTEVRGLTLFYTDSLRAITATLAQDQAAAANLVLHEQVYSEFAHVRVGNTPRAPEPRFDIRMDGLYDDDRLGARVDGAGALYWLVDLQRLDRQWLVDWNGLERDEPDVRATSLTFAIRAEDNDGDYQEAVIERVVDAFEDADPRPASVIIGAEMERHYAAVPEDWPAFASFVRDLAAALRAVDPAVRVGVGINWSSFMDTVVPRFVEAAGQTQVNFQAVRLAWEAVLDPLYLRTDPATGLSSPVLDFYAFAAVPDSERYPTPAQLPEDHLSGPATFFDEYPAKELPVAWFAVGWPVNGASSEFFGAYWQYFVTHAGGVDVELAAWWGYGHLLRDSDCGTMTNQLGLPRSACFRGLYTSSGSPVADLRDAVFSDGAGR